jgi:hypothetical protein
MSMCPIRRGPKQQPRGLHHRDRRDTYQPNAVYGALTRPTEPTTIGTLLMSE